MGSPRQEQRAYPRHECDLPVVIEMDTRTWGGVIANISRGGLLVVSTESLLPGRVGAFLFIVPGTYHVSRIMGTVRWVMNTANDPSGPACYGIEFEEELAAEDEVLAAAQPHSGIGREQLFKGMRGRKD